MYEVTAGAEEERVPQSRLTLSSILLVAAALAFVTALILFSGELSPAWFLYLLPIIIGALAYDVAGGVVVTALSAAAVFLAAPTAALSDRWPELTAGFMVFLLCGIVVGLQARRQRMHNVALERASALDALTGVLKPEHFISALGDEVRRGDRYGHDLGLILIRVEGFDEFSRVFGHYKAESMLQHLADIVRLSLRVTDTVGRLEPTVFAVAVPHADPVAAAEVATRLAATTRAAEFEGDALEPITACVTSTASASYPGEAANPTDLLDRARSRLEPEVPSTDPARGTQPQVVAS